MSNINSVIYCPRCGEANYGGVQFCVSCATKLASPESDNTTKEYAVPTQAYGAAQPMYNAANYAPTSGTMAEGYNALQNPMIRGAAVGTKPAKKRALAARTTVSVERGIKGDFSKTRACAFILFAISFLMFLASFLPMVKVETSVTENSSFSVSFSPSEILSIGIDSIGATTSEEYLEEYQDYINYRSAVQKISFTSKLTKNQEAALKDYTKSALKLQMMSANASPKATLVMAAFVSLVYIFTTVATFAYAFVLFAFYGALHKDNVTGFFKLVKSLVAIILVMLPVYMLLMLQTANFSPDFGIYNFGDKGTGLAWYGIIMVIVIVSAVAFMSIKGLSCLFKKEETKRDHATVFRALALVCLILAVAAVFMPFAKIRLATVNNRGVVTTESMSVPVNNFYEMSYEDVAYFNAMTENYSKTDLIAFIGDIVKGRGTYDSVGTDMFNIIAFRYNESIEYLYTLVAIFAVLSALVLSLFARSVMRLVLGKTIIKHKKGLIAGSITFVSIYLVLGIIISIVCNTNMNADMAHYVLISVGVGPILAAVCTLVAIVALSIRSKSEAPREHDNPDVSYTPYVI